MSCESNPSGIADGGEIYARYLHLEKQRALALILEPMQWGETHADRDDCLAIHVQVEQVQGIQVREEAPGKTGRHKAKKPTISVQTMPATQPPCFLNASFSSEITARCLLVLLDAPPNRSLAFWEWSPDGRALSPEQSRAVLAQRKEARQRARAAQGQWESIVPCAGEESYQLADSYLAPICSRLL